MNNNFLQYNNVKDAFRIDETLLLTGPVLLVDDMVDSRWTFTVIANLLRKNGSVEVFPFALANTNHSNS
jgi:ATP-dependent DNA helicase RecQ